ncbi:anti-sigma factor domain-containing protein [Nocardioides sp.]|uniref:anti-sigma factor n=1 Tax=Nocardioides sp. TaxID=35761 RepID=UPI003517BDBF
MTDLGHTRGWEDAHALSGAYALDALDAEETARFEAHLSACPTCAEEVAELRATAAVLGITTEVAPPASLRSAVLADIASVRPLPPLTHDDHSDEHDDTDQGAGAPGMQPLAAPVSLQAHRQRRLLRRPLLMVAAAATVVAGAGIGWSQLEDDAPVGPNLTAAERVLAAPDAKRVDKRFPDGSEAAVVVSRELGKAVIITDGMTPAPNGHDYEVWFQSSAGDMIRAGLMPDIRDNTMVLEGDASRAVGIGITVEPDGGSQQPSADPIAYFNLEA